MRSMFLIHLSFCVLSGFLAAPAQLAAAEPVEAIYNRGVELYRAGEFLEASQQFKRAAAARDISVATRARYNLGNTHYARALSSLESEQKPDPAGAIEHLEQAIENYRSALRLDAADLDARANIELANRLIKQLQQQQDQQQQDQQPQDQQQQDQQQQDQQQQDQQQQDQQPQDQQPQDQQPQDQQQQDQQQQDQQQQDQQQQDQQQQDQQPQDQQPQDQQPQDQQPQDQQQQDQQPQDQQQQDQQQQDQQQQDQQQQDQQQKDQQQKDQQQQDQQQSQKGKSQETDPPSQSEPSGDEEQPETPQGELSAANPSEEESRETVEQTMIPDEMMEMTEEEARKMLQTIRDRDMVRRLRRQAVQRSQRVPVQRDW